MKVFGKYSGKPVFLTRIRKRQFVWPCALGTSLVFKTSMKSTLVSGSIPATVVRRHHLAEIAADEFEYISQDGMLTLRNPAAISGIVTSKGTGPGTTVTDTPASVTEGIVSIDVVSLT